MPDITLTFEAPTVPDPIVRVLEARVVLDNWRAVIKLVEGQGVGDHYSVVYMSVKENFTRVYGHSDYEGLLAEVEEELVDRVLLDKYREAALQALNDIGIGKGPR